jgi:tetratricopeptide (TPR) repeat protein
MKSSSHYLALSLAFFPSLLVLGLYSKVKLTPAHEEHHTVIAATTIPNDSLRKTPQLQLTGNHKKEEKNPRLTGLKIDVKVIGNIAITTMDMIFLNENDRVLEGELIFPLGEGQTVSRFALEVNGHLREAVVVDKNKGQQVFEELIRQKVDPGLIEQVQGNSYRARVYPLPTKGTKRLVIAYEEELPGNGNTAQYYLPLDYKEVINDFALHIDVAQQKVIKNSDGIIVDFKKEGEKKVADIQQKNFNASSFLAFNIEKPKFNKVYFEETQGKKYFYAPVKIDAQSRSKKLPSYIALFWDASGSGSAHDVNRELEVLKTYFSKIGSLKLTVIPFANKILEEKQFNLSSFNFQVLENYLKSIPCDGATQLNALEFDKYNADEIILMSDGLSNFGAPKIQNSKAPIITISAAPQSDFDLLKYMAQSTGGNFINLNTTRTEDAVMQLLNEPLRIISIVCSSDKSADMAREIFPIPGTIIHDGFSVSGISTSLGPEMVISYGYGKEKTGETKIVIDPAKTEHYDGLIKRIWAQKKLQSLLLQTEKNKDKIITCAVENKIVTPYTSLIVLDRMEDYLKYNITPPGEFKNAYDSAIQSEKAVETKTKKEQLENVVNTFNERKIWWEKDFSAMQKQKVDTTLKNEMGVIHGNGEASQVTVRSTSMGNANTISRSRANTTNADAYYSQPMNEAPAAAYSVTPGTSNLTYNVVDDNNELKYKPVEENKNATTILTPWEPTMPYLTELKKATTDNLYSKYLGLKKTYGTSPSFYLDVADLFIEHGRNEEAARIVSNLAEMDLKNYRLLRVLAHKLEQTGNINDAVILFQQVLELRKEEPQSYRDLGLALAKNNQKQEAIEMLYKVVEKNWDGRFPEIEVMVMSEINNIIASSPQKLNTSFIDSRLIMTMPVEARVILNWDADNCDIDLWVTDPKGEKCFYGNRYTKIGGRISPDFTRGYGPEEFIIKNAMKGKYKVEINYFGTREQTLLGPTTIQVEMYTHYGKTNVKLQEVTRRLEEKKETMEIGTFVVE